MIDNFEPPDQEEVETELSDLLKSGDRRKISARARIAYGTLTKQLNPHDVTESTLYEMLMFLYGCAAQRPELEESVWALMSKHRPRRLEQSDTDHSFDAAYHGFKARLAESKGRLCTEAQLEEARMKLFEAAERVGRPVRVARGMETPS